MMAVIVNHKNVVDFALSLKPATCAREGVKRFSNLIERNFELETDSDRCERVINVMHAWHAKGDLTSYVCAAPDSERRAKVIVVTNSVGGNISLSTQPVCHATS